MNVIIKKYEDLTLDELYDIKKKKIKIFVVEQNALCDEIDGKDRNAYHVFIREDGEIKAYLRVFSNDDSNREVKIGRVLTTERGKGYGRLIMEKGIELARKVYNPKIINVHSQTQAMDFYAKFGFKQVSDVFIEDTLPHVSMNLEFD